MHKRVITTHSRPQLAVPQVVIEVGVWLALAPLLLSYRSFSWLPLALLAVLFLARWRAKSDLLPLPVWQPLLLWILLLVFSLSIAIQPQAAWFRGWAYAFGFVTLSVVYNLTEKRYVLWWLVATWLAGGLAIAAAGAIGTAWHYKPVATLLWLHEVLPHRLVKVPVSFGSHDGLNPNNVAGSLLPFLYLPPALAIRLFQEQPRRVVTGLALVVVSLAFAGVLVLTQSRSGYIAGVIGCVALATMYSPRLRWLLAGMFVLLLISYIFAITMGLQVNWETTLSGRPLIWRRAWYLVQDFGFTGIGLNMFVPVSLRLYPEFLGPYDPVVQAHNILLQLALDFGLLGIVACTWLLAGVLRSGMRGLTRAAHTLDSARLWTLRGLLAGQIAVIIFSMTDIITFGSKQGFLLWTAWALILRLGQDQVMSMRIDAVPQPA